MTLSVNQQTYIFTLCIVCGVIIGVTFDFFRIIRRTKRSGTFATSVEDLIYWITSSAIVFAFILATNSGEIRWFTFLGVLIGFTLYFLTISRIVVKTSIIVIRVTKNTFVMILGVIFFPLKILYKIFRKPLFLVFNFSRKRLYKIKFGITENTKKFKKVLKKI